MFNLIIEGIGYLNRIRIVTPKKGPAYTACTINAMMGESTAVEYVSIDCRIVGAQALEAVKLLEDSVKAKQKVIVGFRAGDPKPDFYEFPDSKTGEVLKREGLKARLLQLTFAKVDGHKALIPVVERPTERGVETAEPIEEGMKKAPPEEQRSERREPAEAA
ncbi:DUF3577 domain-containing protein [Ideonella sp. YS5]|uniref:DUF3577 domain-containing protein n=1 Tax=Ideonella sp. YS5 TaxID=3453714 RepID=UPI003EF07891